MKEDPLVRSIRRSLSQQLTKGINDFARYPEVRLAVLQSLSALWGRLESLKEVLRAELGLLPEQPLFHFYLKGGNAYECVITPPTVAATQQGGGDSDWDSQIVIDPWAPLPVQEALYAAIEDLVLDELRNCAVEIASWSPVIRTPDELLHQAPPLLYRYKITLDDPQTIRQVLDHSKTGLWLDTRRKLSAATPEGEKIKGPLPGMIFNDGIQPFQLFRLGYTWHAEPLPWEPPPQPGQAVGPVIARPLLMELIDVTLPRRRTVEAVEVWTEIQDRHLAIAATPVSTLLQGVQQTVDLPLPSLSYHFNEQVLMLCEVAAGVSKSVDKVARRFARLTAIYNAPLAPQAAYRERMAAMAGIPVATLQHGVAVVPAVDNVLNNNGAAGAVAAVAPTPDFLARNMMYEVARRRIDYDGESCLDARRLVNALLGRLTPLFPVADAAASDDLALYSTLVRNGYFDTKTFPASGIAVAAYLRLRNPSQLEDAAALLKRELPRWLFDLATAATQPVQTATQAWVSSAFFGKKLRAERRTHTSFRTRSISQEETLVVFADDRAAVCLTLTAASPVEAPFLPDPLLPGVQLASPVDLAEQRKVAAAMILDFCIRNALSKQLTLLNNLFDSA